MSINTKDNFKRVGIEGIYVIKNISFMNIETGLGRTIYTDNTLIMSEELIWPMICALNNFVIECTQSDRGLINASLEDIKIYLYSPLGEMNPLRFVFFTDLFENNEYIEMRGQALFETLSQYISYEFFNPPTGVMHRVNEIAGYTQIFPSTSLHPDFLERIQTKLNNLEEEGKLYLADFFVGDIDQGIVFPIASNEDLQEKTSVLLFSELLTTFSLDSRILVKSGLSSEEKRRLENNNINTFEMIEGWYIKQLAGEESDFWLVGYMFFKERDEEEIRYNLDWIADEMSDEIINHISERPF